MMMYIDTFYGRHTAQDKRLRQFSQALNNVLDRLDCHNRQCSVVAYYQLADESWREGFFATLLEMLYQAHQGSLKRISSSFTFSTISHTCLLGDKFGLIGGYGIVQIFRRWRYYMTTRAQWGQSFSSWKVNQRPWRRAKGITQGANSLS